MNDDRINAFAGIRAALDAAEAAPPADSLPHLRLAAEQVTGLIDESMAAALLAGAASLRSAAASAGFSENAVGPRLARTRGLGAYANADGRVTAAGVQRAQFDHEVGTPRPAPEAPEPLRFKPRRSTR